MMDRGRKAAGRGLPSEPAELPSNGLLSFYDRLRERVAEAALPRGGRMARGAVEALLLAPDLFVLLLRLGLDREVPRASRTLFLGGLAYFVLPVDLLPEAFVGATGLLDDVVLASAILGKALGGELELRAQRYWSGSQPLRQALGDIARGAHALLGADLSARLRRLLARRGVELPAPDPADPGAR